MMSTRHTKPAAQRRARCAPVGAGCPPALPKPTAPQAVVLVKAAATVKCGPTSLYTHNPYSTLAPYSYARPNRHHSDQDPTLFSPERNAGITFIQYDALDAVQLPAHGSDWVLDASVGGPTQVQHPGVCIGQCGYHDLANRVPKLLYTVDPDAPLVVAKVESTVRENKNKDGQVMPSGLLRAFVDPVTYPSFPTSSDGKTVGGVLVHCGKSFLWDKSGVWVIHNDDTRSRVQTYLKAVSAMPATGTSGSYFKARQIPASMMRVEPMRSGESRWMTHAPPVLQRGVQGDVVRMMGGAAPTPTQWAAL